MVVRIFINNRELSCELKTTKENKRYVQTDVGVFHCRDNRFQVLVGGEIKKRLTANDVSYSFPGTNHESDAVELECVDVKKRSEKSIGSAFLGIFSE